MNSFLTTRRVLGLAAGAAALAVVAGTAAPAVASATDATAPYIGGDPGPQRVGTPISFDYYTHGSPTCSLTAGALPPGVTLDATACGLRGTPTLFGGLYSFTVTATNGVAPDATVDTTLEVDSLFTGGNQEVDPVLGQPFDQRLVSFDYPPPTFSLDDPADLPDGLTLDPDGRLHGTPTSLQHADTLSLRRTNALGSALTDLAVRVQVPAPQITGTPGPATAGTYSSFQFGWTGTGTPTFSVSSGQLPAGLLLLSNGALYGTPTVPGPTQFTVSATDGVDTATEDVTFVVNPSTPTISGTPAMGHRWLNYLWGYSLGGIPKPTTTVTAGSLPPGLSLGTDGYLTGVPSAAGHYEWTVTATNGSGTDASITSSMDVSGGSIVVGGPYPPAGVVGTPYSDQLTLEGTPQPTATVQGNLPPGLTLSPSGLLSGTPTTPGRYTFTVIGANGIDPSTSWIATVDVVSATPTVSIAGHRATEGNRGTKAFTFTVSLSGAASTPVTVHWATANGTATAGSDYRARSGVLTFAPGQTTKTVTVQVKGDRIKEPTETFSVRLSRPAHAVLGAATATGTIVNDD